MTDKPEPIGGHPSSARRATELQAPPRGPAPGIHAVTPHKGDKPEPTAEHIDARLGRVSQAMIDTATNRGLSPATRSALLALSREIDAVMMTMRRDHAAQAANLPTDVMLAALVERGALTEEREWWPDGPRMLHVPHCRLVTPWGATS